MKHEATAKRIRALAAALCRDRGISSEARGSRIWAVRQIAAATGAKEMTVQGWYGGKHPPLTDFELKLVTLEQDHGLK